MVVNEAEAETVRLIFEQYIDGKSTGQIAKELAERGMLRQMDKFAWFMIWTGFTNDRYNTMDDLKAIFTLPEVINYRDPVPHNR